ncbi:hypothetical protein ID0213_02460 [Helicobacter pylori]
MREANALEFKLCKIPIIGTQSETQTLAPARGKSQISLALLHSYMNKLEFFKKWDF